MNAQERLEFATREYTTLLRIRGGWQAHLRGRGSLVPVGIACEHQNQAQRAAKAFTRQLLELLDRGPAV